jgi:hypothetical protein
VLWPSHLSPHQHQHQPYRQQQAACLYFTYRAVRTSNKLALASIKPRIVHIHNALVSYYRVTNMNPQVSEKLTIYGYIAQSFFTCLDITSKC